MKNQVIIDNWSLFDIKELMTSVDSVKLTGNAIFKEDDYTIEYHPEIFIQIKVLLHFLNDLVTRDAFLIDRARKKHWSGQFELLDNIDNEGIIKEIEEKETNEDNENIEIIKQHFVVPKKVKEVLETEKLILHEHWSFFSNVVNESAKYLSKSSKLEAPYSPHPFRSSFLKQTIFPDYKDANYDMQNWIMNERTNITQMINNNSEMRIGLVPIDPIVIEIIENSNSPNDLIKVALQMRNAYKNFRKYMNFYEEAINEGNIKKQLEHKRLLDEIHNKIINFRNPEKYGKFSIYLGFGFLKYSKSIPLIDSILMRKGIRATLQKLVLKSGSKKTVNKLLKMFDVHDKELTNQLIGYLEK